MQIVFIIHKNERGYYQRNREIILNRATEYYENDKERLREQAKNKYRKLSKEEKYINREYEKNRYQNMSEEKKQRLREYQKQCRGTKKSKWTIFKFFSVYSIKNETKSIGCR